ncbi:MAG: hypothetical protein ACBR13_10105 [Microcoleus sp.]
MPIGQKVPATQDIMIVKDLDRPREVFSKKCVAMRRSYSALESIASDNIYNTLTR